MSNNQNMWGPFVLSRRIIFYLTKSKRKYFFAHLVREMSNIRKGLKVIQSPLESLDRVEEDHIIRVLRSSNWNKSEAAKILGITRQTLDNKIEKFKIKK